MHSPPHELIFLIVLISPIFLPRRLIPNTPVCAISLHPSYVLQLLHCPPLLPLYFLPYRYFDPSFIATQDPAIATSRQLLSFENRFNFFLRPARGLRRQHHRNRSQIFGLILFLFASLLSLSSYPERQRKEEIGFRLHPAPEHYDRICLLEYFCPCFFCSTLGDETPPSSSSFPPASSSKSTPVISFLSDNQPKCTEYYLDPVVEASRLFHRNRRTNYVLRNQLDLSVHGLFALRVIAGQVGGKLVEAGDHLEAKEQMQEMIMESLSSRIDSREVI